MFFSTLTVLTDGVWGNLCFAGGFRLEIRFATLEDIEQICCLYNEFFSYNEGLQPEYCAKVKESGEYPKSIIASENADIIIAVENNFIVGFIHIREAQTPPFASIVPHKYAEIIDCIVTSSYRGKGTGAKLIDAAKEWGKARTLDYIELFVLSNAKEAFHFYEQNDFTTVSHTMRCPL